MKLAYNVTGKSRKRLVDIIAEITGENSVYQKAPTYAYNIGAFTVSREGELEIAENADEEQIKAVIDSLSEAGFEYENTDVLSISFPLENFTDTALDNLKRMVSAKASLIMKALGVSELPIERGETELIFPWFKADSPPENIHAYSQFVTALCQTAQAKKRVNATAPESFENEKFTMRVFCIGLGLVGKEYSLCRKLLMNNLSGNSSWRYSAPENGEAKPPRERVHKEVVSVRFTPDMLAKLGELASQSNISRNMLIESVVADFVNKEYAESDGQE